MNTKPDSANPTIFNTEEVSLLVDYFAARSITRPAAASPADALIASLSDRLDTAEDIVMTIKLALIRGYTPAEILDENSPIRDRIAGFGK